MENVNRLLHLASEMDSLCNLTNITTLVDTFTSLLHLPHLALSYLRVIKKIIIITFSVSRSLYFVLTSFSAVQKKVILGYKWNHALK